MNDEIKIELTLEEISMIVVALQITREACIVAKTIVAVHKGADLPYRLKTLQDKIEHSINE